MCEDGVGEPSSRMVLADVASAQTEAVANIAQVRIQPVRSPTLLDYVLSILGCSRAGLVRRLAPRNCFISIPARRKPTSTFQMSTALFQHLY
jgi:hypothetical protein